MNDEMATVTVTRDVTDWVLLDWSITDIATWGWIVYGVQRARYDTDVNRTVATVTLTVDRWHGVVDDITNVINGFDVSVDDINDNVARFYNLRDAIEFALRYDVRNG